MCLCNILVRWYNVRFNKLRIQTDQRWYHINIILSKIGYRGLQLRSHFPSLLKIVGACDIEGVLTSDTPCNTCDQLINLFLRQSSLKGKLSKFKICPWLERPPWSRIENMRLQDVIMTLVVFKPINPCWAPTVGWVFSSDRINFRWFWWRGMWVYTKSGRLHQ